MNLKTLILTGLFLLSSSIGGHAIAADDLDTATTSQFSQFIMGPSGVGKTTGNALQADFLEFGQTSSFDRSASFCLGTNIPPLLCFSNVCCRFWCDEFGCQYPLNSGCTGSQAQLEQLCRVQ